MIRIISGGQTGVDRGALDAAMDAEVACGGSCPAGFLAEDGQIPERYPLTELQSANYSDRTLRNVLDADGTVLIYMDRPTGGTEYTLLECLQNKKPYLLLDAGELEVGRAAQRIHEFVSEQAIEVLNIAGPRASAAPDLRDYTYIVISSFLRMKGAA
jgi:hypothetical protein